jgi:DNA-binding transcriptional regulator YiaG
MKSLVLRRSKKMKWNGDRVKEVRKARGETQEAFAKHFRVNIGTIQTWEQDKGAPSGPATVILDAMEEDTFDSRMAHAEVG